jgi:hypothetical protein
VGGHRTSNRVQADRSEVANDVKLGSVDVGIIWITAASIG